MLKVFKTHVVILPTVFRAIMIFNINIGFSEKRKNRYIMGELSYHSMHVTSVQ